MSYGNSLEKQVLQEEIEKMSKIAKDERKETSFSIKQLSEDALNSSNKSENL